MKISLFYISFFICNLLNAQIILFETDFQSGIPVDMSIVSEDQLTPHPSIPDYINQEAWIVVQDPDSSQNDVVSATSYFQNPDTANRWLITPQITLGSFGNYISWNAKSHDPSFPDDYYVLISTSDNLIESFLDTIGFIEEENFEWTNRTVDLSSLGYNDSTIYVAFVLRTYDGFKLYLDDIFIESENNIGLSELGGVMPKLYPNPTQATLNLEYEGEINEVFVIDFQGNILIRSTEKTLQLSDLINGYYFVKIIADNKVFTNKILKL